jgi:hypothetical protein
MATHKERTQGRAKWHIAHEDRKAQRDAGREQVVESDPAGDRPAEQSTPTVDSAGSVDSGTK